MELQRVYLFELNQRFFVDSPGVPYFQDFKSSDSVCLLQQVNCTGSRMAGLSLRKVELTRLSNDHYKRRLSTIAETWENFYP